MADHEQDIQRIVEQVVRRVRERLLDDMGGTQGEQACERCEKTALECTGCGHSVSKRPDDARKI
ncbi:MAG: hypothetical protein GXP54_08775, partial [Deltaproteobacteria bacterium]|nr:hypothetical protein [Deltaproteobacteria bacterium]